MRLCPICNKTDGDYERILNGYTLIKCKKCAIVYADVDKEMIDKYNLKHYDTDAKQLYEMYQGHLDAVWFNNIASRLTARFGKGTMLDIGCGNGKLLHLFQQYGWNVTGVDPCPWAKDYAQIYGYSLFQGNLLNSNLPSNHFDLITGTSYFEHVYSPLEEISTILDLLKPGGAAFLAGIPNYSALDIRLGISRFTNNKPPDHVNYFTPSSINRLLSADVIRQKISSRYCTTYGIPGLYGIYMACNKWFRYLAPHRALQADTQLQETSKAKVNISTIDRIALYLFIFPWKLFSIGDKLEITILKNKS